MINRPDPGTVLAKALLRASAQLSLTESELAGTLDISSGDLTCLKNEITLDPASKTGELAMLVIRIAQSLFDLEGGNQSGMKEFMRNENRLAGGVPADQIEQAEGLRTVAEALISIHDHNFS